MQALFEPSNLALFASERRCGGFEFPFPCSLSATFQLLPFTLYFLRYTLFIGSQVCLSTQRFAPYAMDQAFLKSFPRHISWQRAVAAPARAV
jgi:hypothetical protein